jgi:Ca2+/Na+ antiporter
MVSRLERVGERLGLSEALLGLAVALAADAPEITSAATAVVRHQHTVGAGVVLGSGPFNLAALLGLGAAAAGRIRLHRKVVLLGGAVAIWTGGAALVTVRADVAPGAGLALALVVLLAYVVVLGFGGRGRRLPLPPLLADWLLAAAAEEEAEMEEGVLGSPGTRSDGVVAAVALVVVVVASVLMEQSATSLGHRYSVPDIVIGALVLGGVTSLPNAVSAIYLVRRGRGAASFSSALNSNNFNVAVGLLIPATVVGLGRPSGQSELVAVWGLVLTALTVACAYRDRGLTRVTGVLIVVGYVGFAASVVVSGLS